MQEKVTAISFATSLTKQYRLLKKKFKIIFRKNWSDEEKCAILEGDFLY